MGTPVTIREAVEQTHRTNHVAQTRKLDRRDVLKLGAFVAAAGGIAPLLAACVRQGERGGETSAATQTGVSGSITVLHGGGDPRAEPGLAEVYADFMAQHPAIEWDIRALTGGGPEFDRLGRAALASGEPVGLIVIDGQRVRGWVRDGLLADLADDSAMADLLARVPERFHFADPSGDAIWAFPLAVTRGVHTTGMYYNKAILDEAGLDPPTTIADLEASVAPLAALGVAPLVHCSGDVFFNQILITWLLPMIAERAGDPVAFAESTIRGEIRYDSPEWTEAFQTIADLRTSGILLEGSGATDYATMQQLMLQGRAAMTFNGSWLLTPLLSGSPTGAFDLHVVPPPLVEGASIARPILAWGGFALPADPPANREAINAFLEYASREDVDRAVVGASQSYSPIAESNTAIENEVAREFLPMFDTAITPMDWLWEPEITAEIDSQVQALVKGESDPASTGRAVQAVAEDLRTAGRSYYP
jgi:ABC-type glycerol-3-phosphate transport system substrate-binding protein